MAAARINKLLVFTALCSSLLAWNAGAREISTNTARLQAMDKITGRVSIVDVPVNGHAEYGTFSIVVRSCKTRSPEETPENFAYVDVVDNYKSEKPVNIFRGWMISSSPALNAVAHPIYDVWLLKCLNTELDRSKLLTDEELRIRNSIEKRQAAENNLDKKEALPQPEVNISKETDKSELEEKVIESGSAIENPAAADETQPSIEEEAEKAIAEFQQAKNAENADKEEVSEPERQNYPDDDAPRALIKINEDGTAEAPKYEAKPAALPTEDVPGNFIVIKKDAEPQPVSETVSQAEKNTEDTGLTPEQEAMLPELLSNAKPISPDELEDADVPAVSDIAEEIPLVTGDEIEENGMVDEDQLIELDETDNLLDIQAESLAE